MLVPVPDCDAVNVPARAAGAQDDISEKPARASRSVSARSPTPEASEVGRGSSARRGG
jgi:hypothetical protein